jgi:hypothetical protein
MALLSIAPAKGFGLLRFGATAEMVRSHLGEPSRIIEPPDEPRLQIWVFDSIQLAAGFDESGVLETFEVFNPLATLHGHQVIGLAVEEAALLLRREFSFPIEAHMLDDGTVEQLCVRDLGFGVWLEDDIVTSVSWSNASGDEDQSQVQESPN